MMYNSSSSSAAHIRFRSSMLLRCSYPTQGLPPQAWRAELKPPKSCYLYKNKTHLSSTTSKSPPEFIFLSPLDSPTLPFLPSSKSNQKVTTFTRLRAGSTLRRVKILEKNQPGSRGKKI